MTNNILYSFLSLFALFGKEEQVDKAWAKAMLSNYLRRHFGIKNIDVYLDLYTDMRDLYELSFDTDIKDTINDICSNLNGQISSKEEALLLLRLMEFCSDDGKISDSMFKIIAENYQIPDEQYQDFTDFVTNHETKHVLLHKLDDTDGWLKTLLDPVTGLLIFTYTGDDTVMLNDVPVLPGAFQVWLQSSVLKGNNGKPIY